MYVLTSYREFLERFFITGVNTLASLMQCDQYTSSFSNASAANARSELSLLAAGTQVASSPISLHPVSFGPSCFCVDAPRGRFQDGSLGILRWTFSEISNSP